MKSNIDIYKNHMNAIEKMDIAEAGEYVSQDCIVHFFDKTLDYLSAIDEESKGWKEIRKISYNMEDYFSSEENLCVRWSCRVSNKDKSEFETNGISIVKIRQGKIIETWNNSHASCNVIT